MNILLIFLIELIAVLLAWFGLRRPALLTLAIGLVVATFVVYGFIGSNTGIVL